MKSWRFDLEVLYYVMKSWWFDLEVLCHELTLARCIEEQLALP